MNKTNSWEHVRWGELHGGLNLRELDYELPPHQSPRMENLWWRDGLLGCRDGQSYVNEDMPGEGICCYPELFWGYGVFHLGDGLYAGIPGETMTLVKLCGGLPKVRGSFFAFDDTLYYKTAGVYKQVTYDEKAGLSACDVAPYIPTTWINCEFDDGTGKALEEPNLLTDRQNLLYDGNGLAKTFVLPENAAGVAAAYVDGVETTDFDLTENKVVFYYAPSQGENNVCITAIVPDATNFVNECTLGCVYGGPDSAVAVLAGADHDGGGLFWSVPGRPDYIPRDYVNRAGDPADRITGFGRQAGYLIVLKERSVGRCLVGYTETGRVRLQHTTVNPAIGCDVPHTVKTVENNLVWCSSGGVYMLKSTTAAMENNVVCLSRKIAGCDGRPGLTQALREAKSVCALSDGEHYWVAAGGKAFVWDHTVSSADDPSWFYFTGIGAVDFLRTPTGVYHVDENGRISRFVRSYTDYGRGIPKVYRFAVRSLGDETRLKTVRRVVITTRSDTDTLIHLHYETDRQDRPDPTPIRCVSWRLCPRNLEKRSLRGQRFANVAVREPRCRHVQYFGLRLQNDEPGADMSLVSAEVLYGARRRTK